jgi:hypothetical protein
MSNFIRTLGLAALLAGEVYQAGAFTLLGPDAPWQTTQLGYNTDRPTPIGSPMSIGEEYRWNVPVIYYGFTPDFLNFFGQTGVTEVEKAIKFFNDLPSASQLNLDNYPLTSQRINQRAQALGLMDLKSFTMTIMMNELGLTDPTRYVFTLRDRWIPAGGSPTNYFVIKRNFDPVTWQHSSYINGQLWTYATIIDNATGASDSLVINTPVDPLALTGLINSPVTGAGGTTVLGGGGQVLGGFWTGLTRDDVGGLKYIYRRNNYNVETAPTSAFSSGGGGGPWGIPGGGTNNVFVNVALRPGVDKVQFVRANYNSLFGQFTPFTNSYSDSYITNGSTVTQGLQRALGVPDILFDAADIQGGDNTQVHVAYAITTNSFVNNDALNGDALQLGPGVINVANGTTPVYILTYNSVGPMFFNSFPSFLSEVDQVVQFFNWGSFDGSTNEPVVYPISTSILEIEQQALSGGGGGGGGPWSIPPVNTNTTTTATGGGGGG